MKTVWLIDIDGTISDDIPNETPELFPSAEPIPGSLKYVQDLIAKGDRVVFFTARTDEHAEATEEWLHRHGYPFEYVVYNKPRIEDGWVYHWIDNREVMATCVPMGLLKKDYLSL
tara:strand:- start:7794 stop:8138 length:345 start_codon:yes stop_codon:yes gene_type:complete